jgi:regulator of sirC expression with transglutaminase-like and TPR domain
LTPEEARALARAGYEEASRSEQPSDLLRAVAWIAAEERPSPQVDRLLGHVDQLLEGLQLPPSVPVFEAVARVNLHLFQELGFEGAVEDYHLPTSSLLDHVLANRRGLPILLSVIYLEAARRVGLDAVGVGFPGHFLVEVRHEGPRFWVDPFHQGRILQRDALRERLLQLSQGQPVGDRALDAFLRPASNKVILARVNNNLKGAWLRRGRIDAALRAAERLLWVAPEWVEEHRERGAMLAWLGRTEEAAEALEIYLKLSPGAQDASALRAEIQRLRQVPEA